MMAHTRRTRHEHTAATVASKALHRAGIINPTHDQTRSAERCAMRHILQHLAARHPHQLIALRDELAAAIQPA